MVDPFAFDLAERHDLAQRDLVPLRMGPFDQERDFILVEALQRHGVELDLEPGLLGRGDSPQHVGQPVAAAEPFEQRAVHRIERDVDPPDPRGGKIAGVFLQLGAVGGERQFLQPVSQPAAERVNQLDHVAPYQRLAPGQAYFRDAPVDERQRQLVQLFEAEHFLAREELHRFGHAIRAAQVAAIGDGQPQIADPPVERIDEGFAATHGVYLGLAGSKLNAIPLGRRFVQLSWMFAGEV